MKLQSGSLSHQCPYYVNHCMCCVYTGGKKEGEGWGRMTDHMNFKWNVRSAKDSFSSCCQPASSNSLQQLLSSKLPWLTSVEDPQEALAHDPLAKTKSNKDAQHTHGGQSACLAGWGCVQFKQNMPQMSVITCHFCASHLTSKSCHTSNLWKREGKFQSCSMCIQQTPRYSTDTRVFSRYQEKFY